MLILVQHSCQNFMQWYNCFDIFPVFEVSAEMNPSA